MESVETLLKGTVEELDRLLNAKNVLGDPIEKGDATVIPIVSSEAVSMATWQGRPAKISGSIR